MLAKRIIPCLDVKNGRVVKGVKFLNLQDAGDPVQIAEYYEVEGADELVFLDISASHEEREIMFEVVKKTSEQVFMPLTVGGGIRCIDDIKDILSAGADKVSINTAGVLNPPLIQEASRRFGSQCIVVAIDAKQSKEFSDNLWEVFTHGGRKPTGINAVAWAREVEQLGAGEILLTSMDCDGTQDGYDLELTSTLSKAVNIPVIASGGAGTLDHLYDALTKGCADAVLAASIFHYRTYTIMETKKYLYDKGIQIRLL